VASITQEQQRLKDVYEAGLKDGMHAAFTRVFDEISGALERYKTVDGFQRWFEALAGTYLDDYARQAEHDLDIGARG